MVAQRQRLSVFQGELWRLRGRSLRWNCCRQTQRASQRAENDGALKSETSHSPTSLGSRAGLACRRPYTSRYAAGTMKMVKITDEVRPPMMVRANGAYCSLPVPSLRAIGNMPMMVASEVIRMGRKRTRQDVITASSTDPPCSSRRCANSTIRMLLEAAMPTSISTPISDITLSVVCVKGRTRSTPIKPMGMASMMRMGSLNDRNCATRMRYRRTTDSVSPRAKLWNDSVMPCTIPRRLTRTFPEKLAFRKILRMASATFPRSSGGGHIDVRDSLDLVVVNLRWGL